MLRIRQSTSSTGVTRYYFDYGVADAIGAPRWLGKGMDRLGLIGKIFSGIATKEIFQALAENRHPLTGQPLTQKTVENRRVGYEITSDPPKSVSIMAMVFGRQDIVAAFRLCNQQTMEQVEGEMKCRVRVGGAQHDRIVGNLCSAEFIHGRTRPIDGKADPQLHVHGFVFNAVYDPIEDKWKAGQFVDVKRDAPYYDACFNARLTAQLVDMGYRVERRGKSWEIASVPDSVVKMFSRRTAVIEAKAAELGIHDDERKSKLGATTREKKNSEETLEESRREWVSRIPTDIADAIRKNFPVPGRGSFGKGIERSPQAAVDFAIDHCFERSSVVTERVLQTAAINRTLGAVPISTLEELIRTDPRLIRCDADGQSLVTTQEILAEERRMIAFARDGRGTLPPLAPRHKIRDHRLNEDQRAAVEHVLGSTDRVTMVQGGAGTGKTTLMTEAVAAMRSYFYEVVSGRTSVTVLAPSAEASRGVLRSEGFKAADTVAKFLSNKTLQERAKGGVLWIDEAGLLGTKTLMALFELAGKLNARIILSGDPNQHRSVERGDPLRLLEGYAGIKPALVEQIQRQHGLYKSAVEHIARGAVLKGFDSLDKMGAVLELPSGECHRQLAWNYANAIEKAKEKAAEVGQKTYTAIVVCPTHAEGAKATTDIRQELKRRGMLKGKGQQFDRLEDLRLTAAEKTETHRYEKGHLVRFHQNVPGFKAGKMYSVIGTIPGIGIILSNFHALSLADTDKFAVFRRHEKTTELCIGDTIRITANGHTTGNRKNPIRDFRPHALNNGEMYRVSDFSNGDIVLSNGWKVSRSFGHFTHGYCITSNASQGKTADLVLVAATANSLGAATGQQFYVSTSRGRHECQIFTDDKEALRRHIERTFERRSATELADQAAKQREQDAILQHQRLERSLIDDHVTTRERGHHVGR